MITARRLRFITLAVASLPAFAAAGEIKFDFPLRCQPGETCFIQNYVDHDSSAGVRDYECGRRSYDGHDGTDIRLLDLKAKRDGVAVLTAADGIVVATRDGMDEVSIRTTGRAAVAGKECGNGAVIDHQGGWQTQYCHLAKGSVRIKTGDRLDTGDVIGLVGLSGATEFPHLHFTVRHLGKIVDPFAYGALADVCGSGQSLWKETTREQIGYRPREILNLGVSGDPPTMELIESGETGPLQASTESSAIVAYVRVIGLQQGDQESLSLYGPDGNAIVEHRPQPLARDQAQHLLYVGRKRQESSWPAGRYRISYSVTRDGAALLGKSAEIELTSNK